MTRILEQYHDQTWLQEITLSGLVPSVSGGVVLPGGGLHIGGGLAALRGEVVSFNAINQTAVVLLEDAASAVNLPVGSWNSSLSAGDRVMVLFFDESNPEDGVVLGKY